MTKSQQNIPSGLAITHEGRVAAISSGVTILVGLTPDEMRAFAAALGEAATRMEGTAATQTVELLARVRAEGRA